VGRIGLSFDDSVVTNDGRAPGLRVYSEHPPQLERGDELGVFHLGSTVVLLLPPGQGHRLLPAAGASVRMGDALARRDAR
jgi:phosphatidylserine decarboxylase